MSKIKLPFDCMVLDKDNVEVKNPFSGEGVMLTPEAVAVYDTIRGCEMTGDYKMVRKGLDWFRKNYPAEYMVLLD
jgi:hypothetical protein